MLGAKKFATKSFLLLAFVSSIALVSCSDQRSQYRGRQTQGASSASVKPPPGGGEPTPLAISIPQVQMPALSTALPDFAADAQKFVQQAAQQVVQPTQAPARDAPVAMPTDAPEPVSAPTAVPIPTSEPQPVMQVLPPPSGIDESVQPCAVNPQTDEEWASACPGVRRP